MVFFGWSGSSPGSIDAECLVYLVLLQRFCFRSLLSNPPILLCTWESKMRSNRSAVACFSVSAASSVSPVNQHVVQLLLFPTRGVLFFRRFFFFFECCIECRIVLNHQPLLHPDPTFVNLSRCVFSNVVLLLRGSPQAPPTPLLSLRHFVIIGSR